MSSTEDTRSSSDYLSQIVKMRDTVASFAPSLKIPTARNLIIQSKKRQDSKILAEYLKIEPAPIIERLTPKLAFAFNTNQIQIKQDDLLVRGISRKYKREQILGTGLSYFVDSGLVIDNIVGGFECEIISVDEQPLTWNLILRRKTDDRRNV